MHKEAPAVLRMNVDEDKFPGSSKGIETTSAASRRLPEVDGLRGIAILLVVSFHYLNNQLIDSTSFIGKLLCKLTAFGWVGVDLFFVLSGFLIGSVLLRNKDSQNYFSTFYIRRILRIVPNYYLLVTLFVVILSIPFFSNNYFVAGNNLLPTWSYFAMVHNFYMAALNNMGNTSMSVTWSIAIEEQFYLVIPFVIYFIRIRYLPYFLSLAIIIACIVRFQFNTWVPSYVLLPCRMDALSFGILISWMNQYMDIGSFARKYIKLLLGAILLDILLCAFLYYRYNDLGVIKHSLFAVIFSIMLLFALTHARSFYGKILRNKILGWVGMISYSLYLFHYLILGLFHHSAGHYAGIGINNAEDVVLTIAAFSTSLLVAWIVYKGLETPMVRFGKRFKY